MVATDKTSFPQSLKHLDEGNLVFPKCDFLEFLRSVDVEVRGFANDLNLAKYSANFIELCQNSVTKNVLLEEDFTFVLAVLLSDDELSNGTVLSGIYKELVCKLANTRINEYFNAKKERDLKCQGKVVEADEMLRPKLKSYAMACKRK